MLPSYEEFLKLRADYLVRLDKHTNKVHNNYADQCYLMIEEALKDGRLEARKPDETAAVKPYSSNYWFTILQNRCLKEGWLVEGQDQWYIGGFYMRHISTLNKLDKFLRGIKQ